MIARIYSSENSILKFALEEIYNKINQDLFINSYDFIIFAINLNYPYEDINKDIKKIFKTNNYLAFNVQNSFNNTKIVNGVSALFIKFENKGKINLYTFYEEEIDNKFKDFLKEKKDNLNLIFSTYDVNLINKITNLEFDEEINLTGGVIPKIEDIGFIYLNEKIIKKGIVVLNFENVEYKNKVITGYIPMGPDSKINVAKDNKLYVVDYKDASLITNTMLKDLDNITDLWYAPILIKRENFYIPRTFKDIKENFYIEFFGNFKTNDNYIQMSFANKEILLKEDEKEAKKLKEELKNIELVFDFSCVAREYILKDKKIEEQYIFAKTLNAPLFGYFTFGEIQSIKNEIINFNQTTLLIGVREC